MTRVTNQAPKANRENANTVQTPLPPTQTAHQTSAAPCSRPRARGSFLAARKRLLEGYGDQVGARLVPFFGVVI